MDGADDAIADKQPCAWGAESAPDAAGADKYPLYKPRMLRRKRALLCIMTEHGREVWLRGRRCWGRLPLPRRRHGCWAACC